MDLVRAVNETTGAGLDFVGRAAAGEVGAAFVRWPDGRDGVLTRGHGSPAELRRTAEVLDTARRDGLPVPRYELITELPGADSGAADALAGHGLAGAVAVVQERLPGSPAATVDRSLLTAMIAAIELFAGRGGDLPTPAMHLLESGPGFCLHESLQRYDDRTRKLLAWIHEVGRSEPSGMTGDDLVHLDFHTGNVLVEDGRITGIVDWDGIGRGDRRFALVTLRFDAQVRLPGADLTWFDELLDTTLEPDVLRLYWAHLSLRLVDWSIRHHSPADVTTWLDFAATRVP
ncbi:phosphotransferase [Kribbella sp. NPDC048915]|uniref:phosphotransferase n=1 Tax=Kribbella sp. NPDC048915 TaxID=3155148 RepID=UPI0033EF9F60